MWHCHGPWLYCPALLASCSQQCLGMSALSWTSVQGACTRHDAQLGDYQQAFSGGRGLLTVPCQKSVSLCPQVICVAEGAGQEAMEKTLGTDASGNPILADVGIFLRDKLKAAIKVWAAVSYCLCKWLRALAWSPAT